jgi:SH3 domain protein
MMLPQFSVSAIARHPSTVRGTLGSLLLLWALGVGVAAADPTRYVTDQYDFNLRAGESTRYKILRTLPSGTRLTLLGTNERTGYAHVRTEDGMSGYMMTRYLQTEPAAREQLAAMRARLAELQQAPDQLAGRLTSLRAEHADLEQAHAQLKAKKQRVEQQLAEIRHAAANAMRINEERKQLQDRVSSLLMQVEGLEHRNLELNNHHRQQWFLIGAGVAGAGVLVGLILPNLRLRRKRTSWGSL